MNTRMSTNAIINANRYVNAAAKKKPAVDKKPLTGLLVRDTMVKENPDPLPVKLMMDVRKAFNNG